MVAGDSPGVVTGSLSVSQGSRLVSIITGSLSQTASTKTCSSLHYTAFKLLFLVGFISQRHSLHKSVWCLQKPFIIIISFLFLVLYCFNSTSSWRIGEPEGKMQLFTSRQPMCMFERGFQSLSTWFWKSAGFLHFSNLQIRTRFVRFETGLFFILEPATLLEQECW